MIAEMHGEKAGEDSSEDLGSEASTVLNTFKSKGIVQDDVQDKYAQQNSLMQSTKSYDAQATGLAVIEEVSQGQIT